MKSMIYIGFVFVFVCIFVGVLVFAKQRAKQYDERQILARNSAFKMAFITLVGYSLTCGILYGLGIEWAYLDVQMLSGVALSATVFGALSIMKDAYHYYWDK